MKYIRIDELRAKLGGVSPATIWRWTKEGAIPRPFKIGGTNVWLEHEVDDHIAAAHAGLPVD